MVHCVGHNVSVLYSHLLTFKYIVQIILLVIVISSTNPYCKTENLTNFWKTLQLLTVASSEYCALQMCQIKHYKSCVVLTIYGFCVYFFYTFPQNEALFPGKIWAGLLNSMNCGCGLWFAPQMTFLSPMLDVEYITGE